MTGTERGGTRPVILVVDDRAENLLAVETLLGDLDATLVSVQSGQLAVETALGRSGIAAIIRDVQMPEMDGFETAEILRLNESTKAIPIIFVTAGATDARQVFLGYESGAVDFLPKPIIKHVLMSKLRVFLELRRKEALLESAIEELKASWVELEESNEALGQFARMAAHDLRAPIRHIRSWAGRIATDNGQELSDEATDRLQKIEKLAARMDELVVQLLEFAKLVGTPPGHVIGPFERNPRRHHL
jgi:CheY-like chemotaxis protein